MILAYEAHHGQLDRSGVPYIFHPARVAAGFTNEAMACVAWLHDVVEDTDVTLEDIRLAGFGIVICDALRLMTHDKSLPYMDYVRRLAKNPIAKAVKLADLRDNMDVSRLSVVDDAAKKRLAKYLEAYSYLIDEGLG
jgi:(p)ppGpp synthase/HD superfamily hydrolase